MANLRPALLVPNNPGAPRICPELAAEIGLNESLIFLQIEFWIRLSGKLRDDGRYWIYESVTDFEEIFSFWSKSTINRAIKNLIDKGLIGTGIFNKYKYDRTRWFALNAEGVKKLKSVHLVDEWVFRHDTSTQDEPRSGQNEPRSTQDESHSTQNEPTIPDLSSDLSPTLSSESPPPEEGVPVKEKNKIEVFTTELYTVVKSPLPQAHVLYLARHGCRFNCPECDAQLEWPTSENKRRKMYQCPECETPFRIHSKKKGSGEDKIYEPLYACTTGTHDVTFVGPPVRTIAFDDHRLGKLAQYDASIIVPALEWIERKGLFEEWKEGQQASGLLSTCVSFAKQESQPVVESASLTNEELDRQVKPPKPIGEDMTEDEFWA